MKDNDWKGYIRPDGNCVSLVNTAVLCLSTPGHTDGTMSFFFDVTDGKRRYRAGMFGGAGTNTLTGEFLSAHSLPHSNRDLFFASIDRKRRRYERNYRQDIK